MFLLPLIIYDFQEICACTRGNKNICMYMRGFLYLLIFLCVIYELILILIVSIKENFLIISVRSSWNPLRIHTYTYIICIITLKFEFKSKRKRNKCPSRLNISKLIALVNNFSHKRPRKSLPRLVCVLIFIHKWETFFQTLFHRNRNGVFF